MRAKDIRTLATGQMLEKERQYKEEFFSLRFQQVTGQLKDTVRLRQVRKNIARIKITLSEKESSKN